jgi:hypothetical protein
VEEVGQVVERLPDELLEILGPPRVERHELALVGLGGEVLGREALRAADEHLELLLVLGLVVVRQAGRDRRDPHPEQPEAAGRDGEPLEEPHRIVGREAAEDRDDQDREA